MSPLHSYLILLTFIFCFLQLAYVPVSVTPEYKTNLVQFVGPLCDEKAVLNYTIDIRFVCGNNLVSVIFFLSIVCFCANCIVMQGYPYFPTYSISSKCKTILHWETAAACKGSSSDHSFGIKETPCYVIDTSGSRYDLTPLIRLNGSYKVWSSEHRDFFINVCTDVSSDKCHPDWQSSACIRNENGQMESVGSSKWASIEFKKANQAVQHKHIELSYKSKTARCNSLNTSLTTNIRFICPKNMPLPLRYPVLVSSLDCRYDIEWMTDYACPQEEVKFEENNCIIGDINLSQLRSTTAHEFNNIKKGDGSNVTILLNVCGSVANDKCQSGSSVCILKKNGKTSMTRKKASFIMADNRLRAIYMSSAASCNLTGDNSKYERTIVEFECDPYASTGKPEFIDIEDCVYLFKWRTKHVCPLLEAPTLNCTYVSDDLQTQIDLSSLTLNNAAYEVQRHAHDPKYAYLLSSSERILLNVCGTLPRVSRNYTSDCAQSAACLVTDKNTSISLGHFLHPLTYDQNLKSLQLRYSGGLDPKTNRKLSTVINFKCQSWSQYSGPLLTYYDKSTGTYTIEFSTPAACPLQTIQGSDCIVQDPLTNFVYNLKPLSSKSYYSIKTEGYDFELNVCGPVKNGSCGDDVAICQKEHSGEGRKFSLGKASSSLSYWNTILNMTFVGGSSYNDAKKTSRKSHISFICDPNARNGFPEFAGEKDQAYFFRWYTSLACSGPVPKVTHCVFENSTHMIDLNPLVLERGNHFELGKNGSLVYVNFCRPLNHIRNDLLSRCKPNSGSCLVDTINGKSVSLGEPAGHPFMGFDGNIYLLYNNGDPCPVNKSMPITSSIKLICDPSLDEEVSISFFDAQEEPVLKEECTYHFVVRSPLACPRPFDDVSLAKCVYTDKRTNLSADFGQLTQTNTDYTVIGANGPASTFSLNMCKPVQPVGSTECQDSAVCFHDAKNSIVSYGNATDIKLYIEGHNLHVRYTNGTACDTQIDGRKRSADIEFICDQSAHHSTPSLLFQNDCLAKFQWRTSAVCNLAVPSCSIVDESTGNFYSLRHLASLSHIWNVTSSHPHEYYILNVCRPLPFNHNCSSSAAACKCTIANGSLDCSANLGKVSDHELSLDPESKNLILVYEDGDQLCDGSVAKTHIRFRCDPTQSGHSGPQLRKVEHCTHYFEWDTRFACSLDNIKRKSVPLDLDEHFVLHDHRNDLKWDFYGLFNATRNVTEVERFNDHGHYTYVFDFHQKHTKVDSCANSAICQVKQSTGFTRDIGSYNNLKFSLIGSELYLTLHSSSSVCGRNKQKAVSSKIRFICGKSTGLGSPQFEFESEDCEYHFIWETDMVCQLVADRADPSNAPSRAKTSGMSPGWIVFTVSMFALFAFAGWLFASSSSKRYVCSPSCSHFRCTNHNLLFLQ